MRPLAASYAEAMGIAVQLTNVLRDVGFGKADGGQRRLDGTDGSWPVSLESRAGAAP